MKRDMSNVARVERFFKEHPNTIHRIGNIASACGLNINQARGAISYLNAKAKAGEAIELRVHERGAKWSYVPEPRKPVVRKRPGDTGAGASPESQAAVDKLNKVVGLGTAQFNRMIDALGDEERQALRERTIGAGNVPRGVITLTLVGATNEGHPIGKDEDTGNVFKVVPL